MTPEELLAAMGSVDDTLEFRETYLRVPFSYPGSKSMSLKHILPKLPNLSTFVEVFGGSGVVMLNRPASDLDVFNDRYSGVVSFFRVVRDNSLRQKLIERIALSPHSREEFMWSKQTWESCQDDVERAARWYIMVQSSFAGRGRFFGRVVKGKGLMWRKIQENLDLFEDIAQRFLSIQLENLDWRFCLTDFDQPDTVFYLDPPYWEHNIYDNIMTKKDHQEMCERIFQCKGFVALSGYSNNLYDQYPWDNIFQWEVGDHMMTQATTTNTSLVHNRLDINRGKKQVEYLFIKEAA